MEMEGLKPAEILLFPLGWFLGRALGGLGRRRRRRAEHPPQSVLETHVRYDGFAFHFTCGQFATSLCPSKAQSQNQNPRCQMKPLQSANKPAI